MPVGIYPRKSLEERFWEKVDVRGPDDCWLWTGCVRDRVKGYGTMWYAGGNVDAHRMSAFLAGKIAHPRDTQDRTQVVRHQCVRTRRCVNPAHLEVGSLSDNTQDALRHGTHVVGVMHAMAKFPTELVVRIRQEYERGGVTQSSLASRFGVSVTHVNRIVRNKGRRFT